MAYEEHHSINIFCGKRHSKMMHSEQILGTKLFIVGL